jgi:RNA ligase
MTEEILRMHYQFPKIEHIDDVLPHVKDREEFLVAERDFGTVINYAVAMSDTFDMQDQNDLGGTIRRECRGIIFDKDGKIMSRPFHKFFNVLEREETQTHAIDISQPHVIMEKMDGSMIRPILIDGYLRLATKMGVTEVSMQAEEWLAKQSVEYKQWLYSCIEADVTPIFEWVGPFNQIVLAYEEADLVLLACRYNVSGEYFMPNEDDACPFSLVPQYGQINGNLGSYIDRQREAENREGDIIRFADGHMLKVKNDWYVRIHKCVDRIVFDRNIVNLIINEEVDDVVPMLPQAQADRVRDFVDRFWDAFKVKEDRLLAERDIARQLYSDNRKRIALEFVPTLENKADASFIFRMLDGKDIRELMFQHIEKHINNNTKWESCAQWLSI